MSPAMNEDKCEGCGRRIVWGKTSEGKSIPLDPTPAVYYVKPSMDGATAELSPLEPAPVGMSGALMRIRGAMVTHFATCPEAHRFSGGGKK